MKVGLLCWDFKSYGVGALAGIKEYLDSLRKEKTEGPWGREVIECLIVMRIVSRT